MDIACANPNGPVVVNGQVTFSQSGSVLTVTNSPSSIINWQQFSIGTSETTRFIQQSSTSAVLNRVVGMDPSSILGTLQSNGRVFLINPNGIFFGAGARIDLAGLVASTLNLSNEDFLAGRLNLVGDPARAASVVNQGHITAKEGGSVYLVGSAVDNQGVITAPNGDVVLAAGNSVRVTDSADSRLQVEITAPADIPVNLSDALYGSRGIYAGLARNSGVISADSAVRTADGRIVLKASKDVMLEGNSRVTANGAQGGSITAQAEGGTLLVDGAIEAMGEDAKGGTVELLGERVGIINAARVDASGKTGGGTVLVGGDYQGENPVIQNASRSYVGPDAIVRADATASGDGGKVVVWADGDTRYYGSISARGGASAGDGGLVEVSGKQYLDFHGRVDVAAPNGMGGNVLLDPQDIVLNNTAQLPPPNNAIGTPDVAFADPPAAGTYTIQISDVTGYSELFLQATNNITVSNPLTMVAGNTIRFEADNNINVNAAITTTGTPSTARPSITLTADADASGAGTLSLNAALNSDIGGIALSGASVTGIAAGTINSTSGAGQNAGNIDINATGVVNLAGAITANGGAAGGGIGRNGGTVSITGAGVTTAAITASGTTGAAGFAGGAGGTIQLDSTNGITTGALAASGGNAGAGSAGGGTGGTIAITNNAAGSITTGNLTARAGAATGTALSSAGSIAVTNNAAGASLQTGAIDTRGNNNGAGGAVSLSAQGALQTGGTLLTSGGAALAGTAGRSGGVVTLSGDTVTTGGAITASGTAGNGANQSGGNAGAITVTANGALNVSAGALTASGGNAGAGGALGTGGNAGTISITNTSTSSGNIATGALTAVSGSAVGGGAAGTAGGVTVTNDNATAGATLATGAINVNGGAKGGGGSIVLDSDSDISVTGAIQASGGGAAAGGTHAGASGGTITITGVNRSVTGNITASGGVGAGANQAGGNAGTVSLTGTGTLSTAGITVSTGAATGVGAGGTAGSITLSGSAVASGALNVTGGANGAGGAISATSSAGLLNVGAIAASGGAAIAGTSGNAAGSVTLTSADALTATTITASGSAGNGANQAGGASGTIQLDSTNGITTGALAASGGNAGGGNADGGNGGSVNLDTGAAATITLASITTTGGNRAGTGMAGAGGNITISDAALLGANTTITATGGSAGVGTGGNVSFSGTLDSSGASRTLTVNTNGATVFDGAVGGTLALTSLTTNATGTTSLGGDVTTTGAQSYGDAVTLTGNATLTGTTPTFGSTVNGGGFDLALDFSGTTTINGANFSNINNLSTGNGSTTQLTGAITTAGAQTYGDAVTLTGATSLTSTGNQAIAFNNTVNGARTLAVNTAGATTFSDVVGGATALTGLTTDAGGTTSIGANISTNNAAVSLGDAVTLTGPSTISSGTGAVTFGSTVDGPSALTVNSTGATTFSAAVGGVTPLAGLATNAGGTTAIDGGAVTTDGAQSYNDATTLGGAATLRTTAGGSISAPGAVTATAGTLTLDTGSGAATFSNVANDFGTVTITSGGTVSLVDANALSLAGASVDSLQAQTLSGDLTVSGAITATGAGDSIVLAAAQDLVNSVGAGALDPGPGRWLVYSTSPAGSAENGLTGAAGSALPRLYNRTFSGNPPASITEPGNHLIYSVQPALTVTPDDKNKVYGADDPAQTYLAAGFVNDDGVLDTTATAGLTGSFGRAVGESVGIRLITQGTFTSDAGYSIAFDGTRTLTITPAPLTGTIANQNKVYGTDDPALGGIRVTLGGVVNNPAIVTWNGNVSVDDTGLVGTSLASVTRMAGETVAGSPYAITGGTLNALGGAAAGNYTASLSTAGNTLTINPVALSATIANQAKSYGTDDPALAGIAVTIGGVVNGINVTDWNSNVTAINDAGQVSATLASLTRAAGETVAGSPYAITGGTLNALGGAAAGNYTAGLSTAGNTLTINQVALSVTANAQSKTYGAPDPTLTYGAAGLVNGTVTDWNGNGTPINDTVASAFSGGLTRVAGESVAGSPYAITQGTLAANSDYNITAFTGNSLAITPAPLTVTADDASRPQGTPNPPFTAAYSGFQFGETPTVLTGTLSFNTTAMTSSPAGAYPITPYGQSSTNYAINFVDGTLTVTGGIPSQPGTSVVDVATKLVVGGLQQLGIGAAKADTAECSGSKSPYGIVLVASAGGWAQWVCANRDVEPVNPEVIELLQRVGVR